MAKEALCSDSLVDEVVLGKFGSIVIGDGAAHLRRKVDEEGYEPDAHGLCAFVGLVPSESHAAFSFVGDEENLFVLAEGHQVRLPVARLFAAGNVWRALFN